MNNRKSVGDYTKGRARQRGMGEQVFLSPAQRSFLHASLFNYNP